MDRIAALVWFESSGVHFHDINSRDFVHGTWRGHALGRPRRWRAWKAEITGMLALGPLMFALFSCASEPTPTRLNADHPASPDAMEAPPPPWTSRLPLDEGVGAAAKTASGATPVMEKAAAPVGTEPAKQLYTCPMHAQIVRDQPGRCPICNMKLVPMKPADHAVGGKP